MTGTNIAEGRMYSCSQVTASANRRTDLSETLITLYQCVDDKKSSDPTTA